MRGATHASAGIYIQRIFKVFHFVSVTGWMDVDIEVENLFVFIFEQGIIH